MEHQGSLDGLQGGADRVSITLNGDVRSVLRGTSLAELLEELGLRSDRVAIELDRTLVRRALHAQTQLAGGEVIEVVTLVGGG